MYAIAIAMLGLAFLAAVAGVCVVVATQAAPDDSKAIWFLPAVTGGVLIGALIPFSGKVAWPVGPLAVVAGLVGATDADPRFAWCVIGAMLGGVLLGLLIPNPGQRPK